MADNKYNQSLLDMGYTQEQIDSMVNAVSSGQDAMQVVRNVNEGKSVDHPPVAGNVDMSTYKGTDANGNVTTGPWNANLNYNQYGDDSNPNQQSQRGGLNEKYTGEGTSNTYIDYNPDLRTSDLDPNYLYGQAAKDRNRQEAGYIARRNDNIASALYNEGRVSKEDVAQFLASQNEWMNSTEADRLNTIESVWKRLGQIKPQEEEPEEKPDLSVADQIATDTSGKLYGKVTADTGDAPQGIDTLADANSVFKQMEAGRISNLKALATMKIDDIATSMYGGINPYGEQAWRDYQQYYPEFAAKVQEKIKKLKAQDNVNAISSGNGISTTADTADTSTETTSYAVNNATNSVSATQLLKSIDSILESNDSAKSAQELMGSIEKDMATLKNRLMNLKNEARSAFKGDVPQYIVTAYMNNKAQEIQNQLSILEDRYNAAYDRYKTEMSNAQWQAEFDLKKESLELEWWKAKNTTTSTTSGTSNASDKKYTVAERNNNPTNMTVGFMQWAGAELGVDYEVSTDSFWSNGKQLYYAKLIGDPVETTIRILDKAIANGKNPFNTTSWSYINKLGLTVDKWNKMSQEEKSEKIREWVKYEGGNMQNMAYYLSSGGNTSGGETGSNGLPNGRSYDWNNDVYTDYYRMTVEERGKLSNQARSEVLAGFDNDYQKFLAKKKLFNEEVVKKEGQAQGLEVLRAIAQLYNMASNENGDLDFGAGLLGYIPWRSVKDKFNQIKELLKLDKMISARNNGVSFGQVTEGEWKIIENAASALNWRRTDASINKRMEETISALWHTTFGKKMTQAEWDEFVSNQKVLDDWNRASDLDVFDTNGGTTNGGGTSGGNQQYSTNDILSI